MVHDALWSPNPKTTLCVEQQYLHPGAQHGESCQEGCKSNLLVSNKQSRRVSPTRTKLDVRATKARTTCERQSSLFHLAFLIPSFSHLSNFEEHFQGWILLPKSKPVNLREYPIRFGFKMVDLYDSLTTSARGRAILPTEIPNAMTSFENMPDSETDVKCFSFCWFDGGLQLPP